MKQTQFLGKSESREEMNKVGRGRQNSGDRAGTWQPFGNLQNETNMVLKCPGGSRMEPGNSQWRQCRWLRNSWKKVLGFPAAKDFARKPTRHRLRCIQHMHALTQSRQREGSGPDVCGRVTVTAGVQFPLLECL